MSNKPTKLIKAIKEFGQAKNTILDFLSKKGFQVENKLNFSITPDMYEALLTEFQMEKKMQEKADNTEIGAYKQKQEDKNKEDPETTKTTEPFLKTKNLLFKPKAVEPKESKEVFSIKKTVIQLDKSLGKMDLNPQASRVVAKEKELKKPIPTPESPKKEVLPSSTKVKVQPVEPEIIKAQVSKVKGLTRMGSMDIQGASQKNKRKRILKKDTVINVAQEAKRIDEERKKEQQQYRKEKDQGFPIISKTEIQERIKATISKISSQNKSSKFADRTRYRKQKRDDKAETVKKTEEQKEIQSKVLRINEFITTNELSSLMDVPITEIISTCMSLGMMVSINQRLDADLITLLAEEYGFKVEYITIEEEKIIDQEQIPDQKEQLRTKPPVVTVMGHVDHGKTSLLDYIKKSHITDSEAGGITQHINAYEYVVDKDRKITFLDTPGHEAFTAMRARGAKITDLVIIVIAADESIKPQTEEAINHAQAANVPIIFAFTKCDKDTANAEKVKEDLAAKKLLVEDWGGKYQSQEVSSKTGQGINELIDKVMIEAELLEFQANPFRLAEGTVLDAWMDKGRGNITNLIIQNGTLKLGDYILAGCYHGKIKAMFNEFSKAINQASFCAPVSVLGLNGIPKGGDHCVVMKDETKAKNIASKRLQLLREQGVKASKHITLDEIGRRLAIGNFQELNVILKGDVDGSVEALSDSLLKLTNESIALNILSKGVGQISDSDVLLASASDAIIIGFQVRPSASAKKLVEKEGIELRLYSVIYDAINDIKDAMEGMKPRKMIEKITSKIEIRELFKKSKVGTIAGCMVLEGKINKNERINLIRGGIVIYNGVLGSLRRFKDDVKEVKSGFECGLNIEKFNDIKEGDILESYIEIEE